MCKGRSQNYEPREILKSPIGYRLLKSIGTSLDYLQNIRKNIFAMIRQLGPPNFFITLTSVEHLWEPLCKALQHISTRKEHRENDSVEDKDLDFEIRKNPILCSRYFNHSINAFRKMMIKNEELLAKSVTISLL